MLCTTHVIRTTYTLYKDSFVTSIRTTDINIQLIRAASQSNLFLFKFHFSYLDGPGDSRFNFLITFAPGPVSFAALVVLEHDTTPVVVDGVGIVLVKDLPGAAGTRVHERSGERAAVKLRQAVNTADLIVVRVRKWPFRVHFRPVHAIVRIRRALLLFQTDQRSQFAAGGARFILVRGIRGR